MHVSARFIRRPVATTLLSLGLLLAGIGGFQQLAVAPLPRMDLPTVNVYATLPGASPETMASAVATPLERRLGRIAGLSDLTSVSALGQTSLTLQFDLDRKIDAACRDVQAAINAASGDLPPNLPSRPMFQKVNPADAPILILSVTSQTLRVGELYEAANTILAQKISRIAGVGQVLVGGGQNPAVRVQVDPRALAGAGLGLEDVRAVLGRATVDEPKGVISGRAVSESIAATDQVFGAEAFGRLVISYRNGGTLRLRDVARVVDSVEDVRIAAWTDARPAVTLIVRRQPGANIIQVVDKVKRLVPELTASISPTIDVKVVMDRSQTIRASVRDVELTMVVSVLLVVVVVFAFLRNARATLIPTVAVPLSIVGTFGVMYLLDYSLNNLSLMALTISTGFVVDDAIVVTENILRHLERGDRPLDAALAGARQIGFTIVSITLSLLAVFIPLLLMGGVVGRLFREFAATLSIAIAISAVISLTLTPVMASRLLRKDPGVHGALHRAAEVAFERLRAAYGRGLAWVLRHHASMLAVTIAAAGTTVALYVFAPKGLFPQQDTGLLMGISEAPQDISFPAMRERQEALNRIVLAHPAVDHVVSVIGGGNLAANTGWFFIQLKPLTQRKTSASRVIAELRPRLAEIPGVALYLQPVQDLRVGGRMSRTQYQYTLQDADLDELNRWAPRLLDALRALPQLRDLATDQQTNALQLAIQVDRDTASRLGVTLQAVDDALYDAFGQRQVATLYTQQNQYHVVLEVMPELQTRPEALQHVFVSASDGAQVPLTSIARFTPMPAVLSVNHQGQFPAVTLSFNLAPDTALGPALAAIHRAEARIGLPATVIASPQGTARVFVQSLANEPLLIATALLAVYIVLGVLYESVVHPITILSTLPSAGVGALLALMAFHMELSVIGLIAILLLVGIVKKNAIMIVDFALEAQRERGLGTREAIHEASLLRFRPILMTTLAALLGALPLALSGGAGSEMRRPLGVAIVGGLLFSQVLTLFTTPVIYVALDRFTKRHRAAHVPGPGTDRVAPGHPGAGPAHAAPGYRRPATIISATSTTACTVKVTSIPKPLSAPPSISDRSASTR